MTDPRPDRICNVIAAALAVLLGLDNVDLQVGLLVKNLLDAATVTAFPGRHSLYIIGIAKPSRLVLIVVVVVVHVVSVVLVQALDSLAAKVRGATRRTAGT